MAAAPPPLEGVFAALWFSWVGTGSSGVAAGLRVGAALALVLAAGGAVLAVRHRGEPTALHDPVARRGYLRIAGVEFGALAVGAIVLGLLGYGAWIVVWACAVVGAHFLPLGRVVGDRLMRPLGLLVLAVAVLGLAVGLATTIAPALVVGPAAGTCLLVAGALTLSGRARPATGPAPAAARPPRRDAAPHTRR